MFSLNIQRFANIKRLLSLVFVLLCVTHLTLAQDSLAQNSSGGVDANKGKELFSANCSTCHDPSEKTLVGPGLKDVTKRRNEKWLLAWISNSQAVIKSGDKYAVDLYNKFGQTQMQAFPDLSEGDIKSILAYIDSYVPPVIKEPVDPTNPTASGDNSYLSVILGGLLVVMLLVLLVLVIITQLLTKFLGQRDDLNEADKEVVNQKFDLGAVLQSKAFLTIVGVLFFLVVAKAGIDKVMNIGTQVGYAPTQPIAFSHKLHAGANEIDCGYCHTGVYKAKSASIPSANICMNCHNQVKRTSPEIVKIYEAIEKNQPIQWVRVHNLPDLVYFNHSQHTVAGQLDCTNCHGEIKEMEIVQQRSPLTMGWCIDCHRKTVVKGVDEKENNAYYDRLRESHKKDGLKPTDVKVKDIGGLECSKCHY